MSEPALGDWHKEVRCKGCSEMIDARAATCYLCGEDPQHEQNAALVNAAHTEKVNSHLFNEGNAARRDHAATRNIPAGGLSGAGPSGAAYRGARGYDALVKTFKNALRQEGYGER